MDQSTSKSTRSPPVNKDLNNERHRRYYASHKEEINRRCREVYAERKRLSEIANMESLSHTQTATNQEMEGPVGISVSPARLPSLLQIELVTTSSDAVSKGSNNDSHRQYYASHKEEINKRRRQLYADKKRFSELQTTEEIQNQPCVQTDLIVCEELAHHSGHSSAMAIGAPVIGVDAVSYHVSSMVQELAAVASLSQRMSTSFWSMSS